MNWDTGVVGRNSASHYEPKLARFLSDNQDTPALPAALGQGLSVFRPRDRLPNGSVESGYRPAAGVPDLTEAIQALTRASRTSSGSAPPLKISS